jgi:cysteine desulfurase/selenocysteine lyase
LPLHQGDVVLTLDKEHNSNLLPWQSLRSKGIVHDIVATTKENTFSMDLFEKTLQKHKQRIRLVSFGLTSNLDGVTIPGREIVKRCHDENIAVLFDAAQTAPHKEIDVRKLDADFIAFSGHKMLGPTGIGVLYGKKEQLEELQPLCVGGETVVDATYTSFVPEALPHRLEGGLQHYAGIVGLGAACTYLERLGFNAISRHEQSLNATLSEGIAKMPTCTLIGPANSLERGGVLNFYNAGMDAHEIAILLDTSHQVMVRSGAHCVHSWYNSRKIPISVRASTYLYNDLDDVEAFLAGLRSILKLAKTK